MCYDLVLLSTGQSVLNILESGETKLCNICRESEISAKSICVLQHTVCIKQQHLLFSGVYQRKI